MINLGLVHERLGRNEEALACQQQSLTLYRELGMLQGLAESLREIGLTLRALGRRAETRAHWQEALAIFEQLQTADAAQVRALPTMPVVSSSADVGRLRCPDEGLLKPI